MEKDTFRQRLLAIVLPVALQQLLTSLVGASDALMLGMLDQASLSAVSLATQVQFVLSLFVYPFTMGATMLAAQYWGKHDAETVAQVQGIALLHGDLHPVFPGCPVHPGNADASVYQ